MPEPDPTTGRHFIELILEDWRTSQAQSSTFLMGRVNHQTHQAQFAIVYGYCAHVHETARAYLGAIDAASTVVATPLARMCYETALTAHWIAQSPDGYRAAGNENIRNRSSLVATLKKTATEVFQAGADDIKHADLSQRLDSDSDASARNFWQLCDDLTPGGPDAYAIYRAMSLESHPTLSVADLWTDPPTSEDGPERLRTTLREGPGSDTWTFLVAASLIWSGRALDYFDRDHRRRSFLRATAREMGIPDALQLSDRYRRRISGARRARKDSARAE